LKEKYFQSHGDCRYKKTHTLKNLYWKEYNIFPLSVTARFSWKNCKRFWCVAQDHPPGPILTYSMENRSSLEIKGFSASQKIHKILWNPKVHYRKHKYPSPKPVPATSIRPMPSHDTSWRSVLILYSHQRLSLSSGPFHSGFPTEDHIANTLTAAWAIRYTTEIRELLEAATTQGTYSDLVAATVSICKQFWTAIFVFCFQGVRKSLFRTCP
jgi:hypothetical protein